MGWTLPWYSSAGSDFNRDLGTTTRNGGELFGLSVFISEGDRVLRTYFTNWPRRGGAGKRLDASWTSRRWAGRRAWEDSSARPSAGRPYTWWRRHDEYERS